MMPVVRFQQDGLVRSDTMLRYLGDLNDLTQVTACFRVKFYQARNIMPFISYATVKSDNEFIIVYIYDTRRIQFSCCGDVLMRVEIDLAQQQWISMCMAVDLLVGRWRLVSNGHLQEGVVSSNTGATPTITGGGILIIGQEQDAFNGGFDKFQSLRGSLADLKLYEGFLDTTQLISYTLCESSSVSTPSTIHFSNIHQDFEAINVEIEEIDLNTVCLNDSSIDVLFPELRTFQECEVLCHMSGGRLSAPQNRKENRQLYKQTLAYSNTYLDKGTVTRRVYWLGVKGDTSTQKWTYSNLPIAYSNFIKGTSSTIISKSNCVLFQGTIVSVVGVYGEWTPKNCDFKAHTVCHFDHIVTLRMRGLCRRSKFDRKYLMIEDGLFPKFVGEMFSEITRLPASVSGPKSSSDYGIWKIVRKDIPTVKATLVLKSPIQYPVGLNTWEVEDAECGTGAVQLMMTSCKDHQFSCTNGQCINIGQRCDLEVDCSDFSDEEQCSFMDPPEGYDSSKPPARQHRHTPISIGLHINILTIRELDISNFKFVCEIVVTLEWYDDRLKYFHLNYAETINVVSNITDVWIPTLEYLGHGDTTSEVTERKVTLWIRRLSQPLPDDDEILIEGEVFTGAENLLVLKRKMTVTTLCRYNLEAFPFDTQTCALGMVLSHVSSQYVALVPQDGGVTLTGERRMLEYLLVDEQMVTDNKSEDVCRVFFPQGNHSGQTMELTFKNLSTFYVFSTYLPTLIIVVIDYLVFYFPLENFNERIMVGLTGLLVEATFFSQVSSSIPRTAYLKLVDIWFVFCIVSLFLVVVTVAIVQWLQDRYQCKFTFTLKDRGNSVVLRVGNIKSMVSQPKRRVSAQGINLAAKIVFPLLAAAFLSLYISVALRD
ncbi:uncharacterized protein [Panulirus ornatus]|uniref:uncharacterized protein n=1 Tax=Panulirus ornatus TaxID=150431 RepID=UPI003A83CAC2